MTPIDGGELRHTVQLQSQGDAKKPSGFNAQAWTTYATVPAKVEDQSGRWYSLAQANTVVATASHMITIRFIPNVSMDDRVLFRGKTFRMTGIQNPDYEDLELRLLVMEAVKK